MSAMATDNDTNYHRPRTQGGEALPDLDHSFEGYDRSDIFQWELSVQMNARGAATLSDVNEVGKKCGP